MAEFTKATSAPPALGGEAASCACNEEDIDRLRSLPQKCFVFTYLCIDDANIKTRFDVRRKRGLFNQGYDSFYRGRLPNETSKLEGVLV